MANQEKELYEFGPFRLDPGKRLLLRDNQPVPLQLKAFETLLVLVRNSESVVLKNDLMKAVWPDTFVEESNLAQNIFVLRKTLGDTIEDHRYIVTIPGRGYRFTDRVRVISQEESLVVESHSRTRVVIEEHGLEEVHQAAVAKQTSTRVKRMTMAVGGAVLGLALIAVAFRPTVPSPKVLRIRQITHLGTLVHNTRILTDGPRIYFRAWEGSDRVVRYVAPEGGEVSAVEKPFPEMDIDDISPSGSEFLVVDLSDQRPNLQDISHSVWRVPAPSGSPQPVGNMRVTEAKWSPDGHSIACSVGSDLYVVNPDEANSRRVAALPGSPIYLTWSPDGSRLRFSVTDPATGSVTLWQADLRTNTARRLFADWPNSWRVLPGGWTPDGSYFFFTVLGEGTRNVWAIREKDEVLRRTGPQPMQITAGPLTFYLPSLSKDGKSVFVVGEQLRGQLVRYDAAAREFVPYARGISADDVTFSQDGQWMAYVEYPAGVLVRSRVDGSERRQLTFPPMRVFNPQWSPDGTQIAFEAAAQMGAHNKIYIVSSSGGVAALAAPEDQGWQSFPSWGSDGGSILFSSFDATRSNPSLEILDLKTKRISVLPGSAGLYWGRVSPDGRYVAALEDGTQKLTLYDVASRRTRNLAEQADHPRWSADGQYVYFNTIYFSAQGKSGGVYRWNLPTSKTEAVVRYPDFLLTGIYGVGYGVTPEGEILLLRDLSTRDLYALDMELP